MDGISSAANVIGVIQLAGCIATICGGYILEVKGAREEILALQKSATSLEETLQELKMLCESPDYQKISHSDVLEKDMINCSSTLQGLMKKIDTGRRHKAMRKLGFRSLVWPLKRIEVEKVVADLERYKSSFTVSLLIDQTRKISSISKTTDLLDLNLGLNQLPVVQGAELDSYSLQHEDCCLPGTRTAILHHIFEWAASPDEKSIFWLNGGAGTGKSTISRTVATKLKDTNSLGATFFFKRGEGDQGTAVKLFPTIARQLATHIPGLAPVIQESIHDNQNIATKALAVQFDKLLLQPLLAYKVPHSPKPTSSIVAIVIDALDECEIDNDMRLVLRLLSLLKEVRSLCLRVFLTSRPELPIRLGFSDMSIHDHEDLVLHKVPRTEIKSDLSLFLNHRLSKIRKDRCLSDAWPGSEKIQSLVNASVPLFIYAATICRILEDPYWDPEESIEEILSYHVDGSSLDSSKLDGTYLPVLNRLLSNQSEKERNKIVNEFQQVVGTIVTLQTPLSVSTLSKLIDIPKGRISSRLTALHSVLSVPEDEALPVRLFHLSFRDFLLDPELCKKSAFWIDEKKAHRELAGRCLVVCDNYLKRNLCGLLSDGAQLVEVESGIIEQHFPPELKYACQYWTHHLLQCSAQDLAGVIQDAFSFLQRRFLHWLEAMSLLSLVYETLEMIGNVQSIATNASIIDFLHDAKRFIMNNHQIAAKAPLQIYCSGLTFAPEKSIIRKHFVNDIPNWPSQFSRIDVNWSPELQTLEGHFDAVNSVAFSPNGGILASGSRDKTIRLWNTNTGVLYQTLEGHSESITSVAFSPDGQHVASSSTDCTVRLWDTATGALYQVFEENRSAALSVKFSPTGKILASGHCDGRIELWDISTSTRLEVLADQNESSSITSVAFSPDGLLLASGSTGGRVWIWNMTTGSVLRTIAGFVKSVTSVEFSPDGRLLAFGSSGGGMRLWDMAEGEVHRTFEADPGEKDVHSVTFSHNSQLLSSSSSDKKVRIWNTASGTLQSSMECCSKEIDAVAFSPNGQLLASGCSDKAVRIWDVAAGLRQQQRRREDSLDSIQWVKFSGNGRLLASVSGQNKSVRIWNTATGALEHTLWHRHPVMEIEFSHSGQILASSSGQSNRIRLWDTDMGSLQLTLRHASPVLLMEFSPDDKLLVSASHNQSGGSTITLWNIVDGSRYRDFNTSCPVSSAKFSPDGKLLACGYGDTIVLWDITTGMPCQTWKGDSYLVRTISFSPDGNLLACSFSDNRKIWLWSTVTGAIEQTLKGAAGRTSSLVFSPDSRMLASGTYFDSCWELRLFNLRMGTREQTWRVDGIKDQDIEKGVDGLNFSLDGSFLTSNMGNFSPRPGSDCQDAAISERRRDISLQQEEWIALNGENLIWLPPRIRPTCSAMHDRVLALGHASGRVTFIET